MREFTEASSTPTSGWGLAISTLNQIRETAKSIGCIAGQISEEPVLAAVSDHVAAIRFRIDILCAAEVEQQREAGTAVVIIASGTGMPISTTHTLVGAVLGVGLARGIDAIDLRVVGRILVSWVVTIPAGAFLAIVFYFIFSRVLP